tara:strand:- start:2231 stop:3724 length:1494 start_codon:yes stop_codon:yes gene_type:complete
MQRRVYCVGLRKHVEADIDDIVPITGKRGTKYQCVGKYSENGKDYVVKSWVPKADYEALHGPVVDIAAAEEFIGADVEAAEPLAADPVADSPVAEDSSEPLEVAPADQSYFLSESVVLSAIKEMAAEDEYPETITYDCISCGEEIDDEDGHELVGEFQEKCCLPCFKTAFGAEQTFEAQQKDRKDEISEKAALNLITNSYGVKRIVSGPTYYRFVAGTSSKFLMFAVVERNNGTYQAVNVYGRRGASYPTLWTSDIYPTQIQAERASKAKQNKKSRKGYVFLDAEEFTAFMAEHFNSETSDCWNSNCENSTFSKCVGCGDSICDECFWVQEHQGGGEAFDSQVGLMCCPECYDENVDVKYRVLNSSESKDNYMSESPLDESPVDEDPLTAEPSDMGGPEDFSADATIDLEDGEITIHEKGAKSGSKKKLLLGVILVAGLAAAYQNSDAVLSFFEGLKGDDDIDAVVGCMDETANNYDPAATEDDGSCTYDEDPEPTA